MTQAFNLSQLANKVNTSGQLDAATGLYNQTPVANGGTGKSSVTSGALLLGAGTSAMTELPGTTPGLLLASSPTGWSTTPSASIGGGGDYVMRSYTSPATWTKPGTLKAIKVTVIGAGGNGGAAINPGTTVNSGAGGGGGGGAAILYLDAPAIPGPIAVTAGAGTNSFGAFASATAGAVGSNNSGANSISAGGAGGSGSGGTVNIQGSGGMIGSGSSNNLSFSGGGGSSILGGGAAGRSSPGVGANAGGNYGGGGSGAIRTQPNPGTGPGGAGAPGIVVVEEFY